MPSRIIIIQGGQATGKTTLAKRLKDELAIGLIAKDDLKEFLFDNFGQPVDRDESRIYGVATIRAMFSIADTLAENDTDFILECAFHAEFAEGDFRQLVSRRGAKLFQIYCTASPKIQAKRSASRIHSGARHKGHLDNPTKTPHNFSATADIYSRLNIEPSFIYDTTENTEKGYNQLIDAVNKFMKENK